MKRLIPALVLVFAGVALADDAKGIDGKWTIESVTKNGKADANWAGGSRENTGDTYTMASKAGKSFTGKMKVDAAKKTVDLMPSDGTYKGKTLLGIYSLEGDTLKICFAEPGKDRPAKLESAEDSGVTLAVHKKAK
ncbi:TIGR03067 domain-containing protein [Zavarzinella formosa]|uniref:TIGR03067 domain-containing protein n=1 Tax=Zavarzinella formosa TaxID=360055 RepID=UPI0002D51F00|nr:TIGR03067 domain-containing protein [Zavarzinella formosa]